MGWGYGHPDVSRGLAGSELGCREEARTKERELPPATLSPKGSASSVGGSRGCSGLNHRGKHRVVRKSRERVCEQGEESEVTKIAIASEQFQLLTIKIEINAVFVWHMYQLMAQGYLCAS